MVITILIQINIQINVGVLAARNNLKVKNARQPVKLTALRIKLAVS